MADVRFDGFVRRLQPRRGVMRALLGGGAAMAAKAAAGQCLANGSGCDPAAPDLCCTGNCAKHKGKFKCAPAGQAFGCTKKLDVCARGATNVCPDNPDPQSFCISGKKGKPLCVTHGSLCAPCQTDADRTTHGFGPTARCITHCAFCDSVIPGGNDRLRRAGASRSLAALDRIVAPPASRRMVAVHAVSACCNRRQASGRPSSIGAVTAGIGWRRRRVW